MATCMAMSTATASSGAPCRRIQTSGRKSTRVTATAKRKKSHLGADVSRVTTGQAAQATTTPMTVSLA